MIQSPLSIKDANIVDLWNEPLVLVSVGIGALLVGIVAIILAPTFDSLRTPLTIDVAAAATLDPFRLDAVGALIVSNRKSMGSVAIEVIIVVRMDR